MIGKHIKKYCCEDISLIENYDKAINDVEMRDCHHRLEIQDDKVMTVDELKKDGLYFHRPASELIFLKHTTHTHMHNPAKNDTKNDTVYINPAAFSKVQYLWITPDKKLKKMNEYNAKKWHPDWVLLSKNPEKFNIIDIAEIEAILANS